MNKKYIAGGLVFWAGLSGYMGLRILESYTEDAVFAALSAVPAQAQEIRYSFLSNTLLLKGVEYEIPDKTVIHKGTIEQVEMKGFNRKCMFVKPNMPPYDADTLPIVAESISATGIADRVHFGSTQMEQKIADVQVRGWYQRLGMLLDQRSRHSGEASCYEEMYRCRLDGLEVNGVNSVISDPGMAAPVNVAVEKIALSQGLQAPRGSEKVSPVSLYLSGLRVSGREVSVSLQRMDIRDLLAPEPESMAELVRVFRGYGADSGRTEDGQNAAPRMTDSERFAELDRLLQNAYEKRLPYSLIGAQGISVAFNGSSLPLSFKVNGITSRQSMTEKGELSASEIAGLHFILPKQGDRSLAILARHAPEGLILNLKSETLTNDSAYAVTSRYELKGLGVLEGEVELAGDMAAVKKVSLLASDEVYQELMKMLKVQKLNCTYKDSGMIPMILELAAWRMHQSPAAFQEMLLAAGDDFIQLPDRLFRELGLVVKQQLTNPGEIRMTFTSEKAVPVMDLFDALLSDPGSVPLSFSSTPGSRPLTDYLQGGRNE